jgi:hypothetical protein
VTDDLDGEHLVNKVDKFDWNYEIVNDDECREMRYSLDVTSALSGIPFYKSELVKK